MIAALGIAIVNHIVPLRFSSVALLLLVASGGRSEGDLVRLEELAVGIQQQKPLGLLDDDLVSPNIVRQGSCESNREGGECNGR